MTMARPATSIFRIALAFAALIALRSAAPAEGEAGLDVDVALAIGVDISYSMDADEQRLQRLGYVEALTSQLVLDGIKSGPNGRIAVAYYEWAGNYERRAIVPWTIIDGPATAKAFVDRLQETPPRRASRTSVSGGIDFGVQMLDEIPHRPIRKVIDISGDGPNNNGRPVEEARDEALDKGIVINGLPISLVRPMNSAFDIDNLDEYYEDCVIGGPGAFMLSIANRPQFAEATRQKLLKEIAGIDTGPHIIRAAGRKKADCMVGEKMWRQRFDPN